MIEFSGHAKERNQKKFGEKILEVVTITEGKKITVITHYYLGEEDES